MSYSGDAAEQVVRLSLETGEVAVKLAGEGAKQLAILLYAILREQKKTKGKTRLTNMLRSGKELKVFAVKDSDLQLFCREAKKYGVLYCVLKDRDATDGLTDIMVRAEDASKINRIFERFNLATVDMAEIRSEIERSRQEQQAEVPEAPAAAEPMTEQEVDDLLDAMLSPPPEQYHKAHGDDVEWWTPEGRYDRVYKSRVFTDTYSKDTITVDNAGEVIKGGTGYGPGPNLPDEVEHTRPDYALYPQFSGTAYGFLTRGCPRNCGFCIVSKKEGRRSTHVADLSEFWDGQKEVKLLDPNLLACPDHEKLILQLAESGAWVDFTQGLDVRLTTPDNVSLLNRVKTKMLHFAWDDPNTDLTDYFRRFSELTSIRDFRRRRVYVLTNYGSTHEQDLYRVNTLRDMGYDPFVMIYERPTAPPITRQLARWVNNKRIFRVVPNFADYIPNPNKKNARP